MSNIVLERIHQVIVNLVWTYNIHKTYVNKDDPWSGILMLTVFVFCLAENGLKDYSWGQLLFGCDIILPIKITVYYELICQRMQA